MNLRILFALALIPTFSFADSIVQNFSFSQGSTGYSTMNRIQSQWDFDGFSSDLGQLTSVQFAFTASITESCTNNNQYTPFPYAFTPSISGWADFTFSGAGTGASFSGGANTQTGVSQVTAPGQNYGMSADIDLNGSWLVTDAAVLNYFQNDSLWMSSAYLTNSTSWTGSSRIDASMNLTLIYNFTANPSEIGISSQRESGVSSVPEGGATFAMLSASLLAAFVARRRLVLG